MDAKDVIANWIYDEAINPHPGSDNDKAAGIIAEIEKAGFVIAPKVATDEMLASMCELECVDPVCQSAGKCRREVCRMNRMQETYDYAIRKIAPASPSRA